MIRRALVIAAIAQLTASAAASADGPPSAAAAAAAATAAATGSAPPSAKPPSASTPPPAIPGPLATPAELTTTDVRCIVVAGALAQNSDPDIQKVGTLSLIYFWGRLEGRHATANAGEMVADQATKMTAADVNTQAQVCGAMLTAAGQSLQDLSQTIQQRLGPAASGGPGK